jgi:hypothetical protein
MTKKQKMTAQELMSELAKDKDFLDRQRKKQEEMAQRKVEFTQAELPVVEALREAGVNVSSAWDLVNERRSFPDAQPVLLEHLQKEYLPQIREGIARAMADPAARFAWPILREIYEDEPEGRVKDGLAVALMGSAGLQEHDQLSELMVDRRHGNSRLLLALALGRFSLEDIMKIQSRIRDDDVIWKSVADALKKKTRGKKR